MRLNMGFVFGFLALAPIFAARKENGGVAQVVRALDS
jgi:hypothetical protein